MSFIEKFAFHVAAAIGIGLAGGLPDEFRFQRVLLLYALVIGYGILNYSYGAKAATERALALLKAMESSEEEITTRSNAPEKIDLSQQR